MNQTKRIKKHLKHATKSFTKRPNTWGRTNTGMKFLPLDLDLDPGDLADEDDIQESGGDEASSNEPSVGHPEEVEEGPVQDPNANFRRLQSWKGYNW